MTCFRALSALHRASPIIRADTCPPPQSSFVHPHLHPHGQVAPLGLPQPPSSPHGSRCYGGPCFYVAPRAAAAREGTGQVAALLTDVAAARIHTTPRSQNCRDMGFNTVLLYAATGLVPPSALLCLPVPSSHFGNLHLPSSSILQCFFVASHSFAAKSVPEPDLAKVSVGAGLFCHGPLLVLHII